MNIGLFNPTSHLYIDITTILEQFAKDGHKVVLITNSPHGNMQKALAGTGIIFEHLSESDEPKRVYQTLPQAKAIVALCRKHQLDVLYNNFSVTQIISLLAAPFCQTKMVYLRHHSTDAARQYSVWKDLILDKLMTTFSSKTIVPSLRVQRDVISEGAKPENVVMIPYCYNFAAYPPADADEVTAIKNRFPGKRILLMISRYVPQKRYELAVEIADKLRRAGVRDFVFLCLGEGSQEAEIRRQIAAKNLEEIFFLEGFKTNVITYAAACDMLIHTSASEASCHAIKEAGWVNKTVVCCENVGDFSDYLIDGKNAFLVEKENPVEPMFEKIRDFLQNPAAYRGIGEELRRTITQRFTPEAVIAQHYQLLNSIAAKQ